MMRLLFVVIFALSMAVTATAQTATPAPAPTIREGLSYLDDDAYFASVFAGGGISSDGHVRPVGAQFGGSAGTATLAREARGLGFMQFVELGAVGPLADRAAPAWFVGYDLGARLLISRDTHVVPFVCGGYSYLFSQASAINFGAGSDFYYRPNRAVRVEVRDSFTFTPVAEHNVAIRIGWVFSEHNP